MAGGCQVQGHYDIEGQREDREVPLAEDGTQGAGEDGAGGRSTRDVVQEVPSPDTEGRSRSSLCLSGEKQPAGLPVWTASGSDAEGNCTHSFQRCLLSSREHCASWPECPVISGAEGDLSLALRGLCPVAGPSGYTPRLSQSGQGVQGQGKAGRGKCGGRNEKGSRNREDPGVWLLTYVGLSSPTCALAV